MRSWSRIVFLMIAAAGYYTTTVDRAAARQQQPVEQIDALSASIEAAQLRLTAVPGDHVTWAQLGSAYVEQARVTADPTYYDKAEGALRTSLELRAESNDAALTGQGALANARHDFASCGRSGGAGAGDQPVQRGGMGRAHRCPYAAGELSGGHGCAPPDAGARPRARLLHPRLL